LLRWWLLVMNIPNIIVQFVTKAISTGVVAGIIALAAFVTNTPDVFSVGWPILLVIFATAFLRDGVLPILDNFAEEQTTDSGVSARRNPFNLI